MSVTLEQFGLDGLPPDDRLALAGLLWDSLEGETFTPPDWHVRELERRVAAADADPTAAIPWDEFKSSWLAQP
jgi:putative addiction module component (TIGR02574 family)